MNKITASGEYHDSPASDLQPLIVTPENKRIAETSPKTSYGAQEDVGAAAVPAKAERADGKGAAADQAVPAAARLTEADVRLLQRRLLNGEGALARRADLGELNTRIVKMFETLNKGVGEMYVAKAEADRSVLSGRMDQLEDAVNRMEGALRIEFEPVLRESMARVLAEQKPARPSRGRIFWMALLLAGGLILGALFHAPLIAAATEIDSAIRSQITEILKK